MSATPQTASPQTAASETEAPEMRGPADGDVLVLPRGVRLRRCERRAAWFLLAPERAIRLDAVAAAILRGLDGERTLRALCAMLARDFAAPEARVAEDARRFLAQLIERRLVERRR